MRIGMSFSPTIVTNFVGLVFCAFVQDFNCSENAFLEKFRQTAYRYAASKQRNTDFANCRNSRRFCFTGEIQISLITAMQNDTDRHNSNGEYLTFNAKREGKCLLWRDSRRDFTRQDDMRSHEDRSRK